MNVPKLRFSEFNDSYILDTYDNVINIIDGDRGNNYPKESDFYDDEYCLFLNAGNVTKNGFNFSNKSFITLKKDNELRNGKLRRNDVVLTTRGTVGNVALYDDSISFENIRINSGMVINRIKCNKLLPQYLYQFMQSSIFDFQVKKANFGSAQPQLTKKGIAKFNIAYPSIKEQRKVCNFLTLLDKKIELQAKRIEALKLFKKGLLKKLLSSANTYKALKFVATLKNGYAFKNNLYSNKGKYNILTISNVTGNKYIDTNFKNKYEILPTDLQPHQLLKDNDILMSMTGNVGRVSLNKGNNNLLNQRVGLIIPNNYVNPLYLFYVLSNDHFERTMINLSQGAAQANISKEDIDNYKVPILPIDRQNKIVDLLNIYFDLLFLECQKLNELKILKKGLTQNMFV